MLRATTLFALLLASAAFAASPELIIPKIDQRPTINDFLSMSPSPEFAAKFARVDDFIQSNPTNGAPGSEKTVVYMAYTKTNFYVIFLCFDREPHKIAASMTRREGFQEDEDWVEIFVDTYNDQRNAYDFSTNALGVQWDSRYSEATGHQPSFDALWYSDGRFTNNGYVVWMEVPFKSMRFTSAPSQTWRIVLGRSIARKNEYCAWPHISKDIQGTLSQSSVVNGLKQISPGKNIQFIPYTSFRSFRFLDQNSQPPAFVSDKSDPAAGIDAKFVVKDNSVFDFTFNPDFSQVESDEPQVTVNQRFEVFFREKRPFFLENQQYFITPMNLVFTRRIADPQFGTRLTAKYGGYTVGMLISNDDAPGKRVGENDPVFGKSAYFGIVRLTRDIFSQSSIGLIATSRNLEGQWNNVGGGDFTLRLGNSWQAFGQAVKSWTDQGQRTETGEAYLAKLTRTGNHFNYTGLYNAISPQFQTLAGFIPRADYRSVENSISYFWRPEDSSFVAFGPTFDSLNGWDYNGTELDVNYHPGFYLELPRRTYFRVHYFFDTERIRPVDFERLESNVNFDIPQWNVNFATSYWRDGTFQVQFAKGKSVNFVPPEGEIPSSADLMSIVASAQTRPAQRLQVSANYFFTELKTPGIDQTIFDDHIIRMRTNIQFTRELSLRLIVQYEATITNPELTSLDDLRNLNGDVLLTYMVNPWTALYIGYNGNRTNLQLTDDETGVVLHRTNGDLIDNAHQFFLKFSYLLRF